MTKNNFLIGSIISFLKAVKEEPDIYMLRISYRTGMHPLTVTKLRDTLLLNGYIEKHRFNGRRTDLQITKQGVTLLNELKRIQKG